MIYYLAVAAFCTSRDRKGAGGVATEQKTPLPYGGYDP